MTAIMGIGRGWPDPTEPGVPCASLQDGYHWLEWQDGGAAIIGQWSPDSWAWIVNWTLDRLAPEEMDHFHYLGRCLAPGRSG